ncbi:hypothetical protein ACFVFS_15080 [Kitasatospora sp. NPDC057692]|uniref:hypothetical protein n=1 Tax=Kitasatospora sp. NPDC057692 TaxID=3346215 RepID=UPI0036C124B0
MRRLTTVLGALAAAGAMALTLPGTALAATGKLVIAPSTVITDPSGCYNSSIVPLIVFNETDGTALVYSGPNCTGSVIAVVPPGGGTTQEFGSSVFVR